MKLFVYGTLLSPFYMARLFPPGATRCPAVAIGRMYHYVPGCFPAIIIPETDIRAHGSNDYMRDEAIGQRMDVPGDIHFDDPPPPFGLIHGELVEFTNPAENMPPIDRYEGFQADNPLYRRSLVPVKACGQAGWAWIYHFSEGYPFELGGYEPVPDGNWIDFLRR